LECELTGSGSAMSSLLPPAVMRSVSVTDFLSFPRRSNSARVLCIQLFGTGPVTECLRPTIACATVIAWIRRNGRTVSPRD
jgi:hypothetical protein